MTALVQFDPVPEIQLPTIQIGLLWGLNIEYFNPDGSLADLGGYSGRLVINSHQGKNALNLVTWDAATGYFSFGNSGYNIQIAVGANVTRLLKPATNAYAYFTAIDGSGNGYAFFNGPITFEYWGGA